MAKKLKTVDARMKVVYDNIRIFVVVANLHESDVSDPVAKSFAFVAADDRLASEMPSYFELTMDEIMANIDMSKAENIWSAQK